MWKYKAYQAPVIVPVTAFSGTFVCGTVPYQHRKFWVTISLYHVCWRYHAILCTNTYSSLQRAQEPHHDAEIVYGIDTNARNEQDVQTQESDEESAD